MHLTKCKYNQAFYHTPHCLNQDQQPGNLILVLLLISNGRKSQHICEHKSAVLSHQLHGLIPLIFEMAILCSAFSFNEEQPNSPGTKLAMLNAFTLRWGAC